MKRGLGLSNQEIGDVFTKWNTGVLDSFLIEITKDIMKYNDPADGTPLVEKILDTAGQKGTGKWTAINALDLGMPVTLIGESVFARCLSSIKGERVRASELLDGPSITSFDGDKEAFIADLEQVCFLFTPSIPIVAKIWFCTKALYASKIISYAQGFMLIREVIWTHQIFHMLLTNIPNQAAKEYSWKLNNPAIALMWRGGCIIRSVFLADITKAYRARPDLENLLFDNFFRNAIHKAQPGWRRAVSKGIEWGIPTPCFSTALSFYDGYRTKRLPANLLQAQRDYFGMYWLCF